MLTNRREKHCFFVSDKLLYGAVRYIMHIWTAPMAMDKIWALFVKHAYASDSCMYYVGSINIIELLVQLDDLVC